MNRRSSLQEPSIDSRLLADFQRELKSKVPHEEGVLGIVNPTPLVDLTEPLLECAKADYGMRLNPEGVRVYGKFDSKIYGGSIKVRPAVRIIEQAIGSGELVEGQTVFEATSGNFGIALGMLGKLGLYPVAIVSRKLQSGVVERLQADGVRLVNLDIDVCPAPGLEGGSDPAVAKAVAASVGQQLADLGFDRGPYDALRSEAEELLGRQDAIGLAKLLARVYGGFCPEQYDNDMNVRAHEEITGPEIDQQLGQVGSSLSQYAIVTAFGTGGTASGLSRYALRKHQRKVIRVVFPSAGQDVAGIRTREKADGLRFYEPGTYLGEHEVDFEETRKLSAFFNSRGYDIGESGALVLFSCMQMLNYGLEKKLVAMVADGAAKYAKENEAIAKVKRDQVTLQEAAANVLGYGSLVWAHAMFVPREEGMGLIAASLGCERGAISVADVKDVQDMISGKQPSEEFLKLVPRDGKPMLLVCMVGNTSLMLVKMLDARGVLAQSLAGGITGLPGSKTKQPFQLVQVAQQ